MTHFLNSEPILTECPICKGWIYQCHVNGFRTKVEPTPLNLQSEMTMRIEGRRIFQTFWMTHITLIDRTLWHIQQADPKAKVFASHSCKTPTYFEPEPLFTQAKPKEPTF